MSTARVIKKYPNRRLYDTDASRYITLSDIRDLVLENFALVVVDKKTGTDITRTVLLQVISDQEQNGDSIMSEAFLTEVIRCYGKVVPAFVSSHLEHSLRQVMDQPQNLCTTEVMRSIAENIKQTVTSGPELP